MHKYSTHKILNQNPILKTPDINDNIINAYIDDNGIKTQNTNVHKIRHVLSKNLAFKQKKHSNTISSPNIVMKVNINLIVNIHAKVVVYVIIMVQRLILEGIIIVLIRLKIKIIILQKHQVVLLILFQII